MSCARVLFCLPPKTSSKENKLSESLDHSVGTASHAPPNDSKPEESIYFDAKQSIQSEKEGKKSSISFVDNKSVKNDTPIHKRSIMFRPSKSISTRRQSRQKSKMLRHQKSILPCEEQDDRPLISDLLKEHSSAIEEVRGKIQKDPLYDSERYDDIWILRFVLSHKKKTENAISAALQTMKFRHEKKLNDLGDIRHKMPNHIDKCEGEKYFKCHRTFMKYCEGNDVTMHTLPNPDRGIVSYILLEKVAIKKIAKEVSDEELQDIYLYLNECLYQELDATTRRTGRLTTLLRVLDMTDMAMQKFDIGYAKKDAVASKATEDYYPKLLGSMLVVNAPSWLNRIWLMLRPLFPSRVTQKINFVAPMKRPQDVKPFLRYISKDDLPTRYGGNNEKWPLACAGSLFENSSDVVVELDS